MKAVIRSKNKGFTLIELMIVVAIVGILAVLAVVGVRRYLSNAKSAEARNGVAAIGKRAAIAWTEPRADNVVINPGTSGVVPTHALCPSAVEPVPLNLANISGKKYQSNNANGFDFHKEDGNQPIPGGFACLRFEISNPQSYQYNYASDMAFGAPVNPGSNVTVTAIGDINGDGVTSRFRLTGAVQSTLLTLAPSIEETNPDE